MRLLPCRSRQCVTLGAMLPASVAYPRGEPHFSAQYVREYVCSRCEERQTLAPADYARLRALTLKDFERLADQYGVKQLRDLPTADLVGAGFKKEQARDLFVIGIKTSHDVAELARPADTPRDSDPGPGLS